MTAVAPAPGEVIGDYEILERIGGNMGLVYKAHQRRLKKVVALKLLRADSISDPALVTRFEREIEVLGQLNHPNLVAAADARRVDGWLLVAMEWIDGLDLSQMVRFHGPLPIADACEAAREAALGLQHCHERGLVHRDIKPANLMLTSDGRIKVIDLGLALPLADDVQQLTQAGHVMGTLSYCAPEQFRDASHVDIRADIYSLGCTLHHLLTGKSPYWQRKTPTEAMHAHLREPFPSLREARPDVPAELQALVARMTAKDPGARLSTPREVAEALEPFARGADLKEFLPRKFQPGSFPPVTSHKPERRPAPGQLPQPKRRWTRRAALLVLLPGVTGTALLFRRFLTAADSFVVLMDTTAEGGIYDKDNVGNGGSNAKEVAKVLQEQDLLPSRSLHQERIDKDWAREAYVLSLHPDLVVIHRSAFFHALNAELGLKKVEAPKTPEEKNGNDKWQAVYDQCDHKLRMFIAFIGTREPRTKFLVYSRGTDTRWLEPGYQQEKWIKPLEADYPELKDRITTMTVMPGKAALPGEDKPRQSFRNRETGKEVRTLVKTILSLPSIPE